MAAKNTTTNKHCLGCGKEGHNIRTCGREKINKEKKKRTIHCGFCHVVGHNITKCKATGADAERKEQERLNNLSPNKSINSILEELKNIARLQKEFHKYIAILILKPKPINPEREKIKREFLTLQTKFNGSAKQAYHKMCLKYHPDKNPEKGHLQKWVNEIYEIYKEK